MTYMKRNSNKARIGRALLSLMAGLLGACTLSYSKSITKEAALGIIASTAESYTPAGFHIDHNHYETTIKIDSYAYLEGGERGEWVASEEIKAAYAAPIPLSSSDSTAYSLTYVESYYYRGGEGDSSLSLSVSKSIDGSFIVTEEDGETHVYDSSVDTKIADFIEMPTSMIRKDGETALSIAEAFLESVDYVDASNPKTNTLTSFSAMSLGGDNLDIAFVGNTLQLRNIYNVEAVSEATFTSFEVEMEGGWVSAIESDFTFAGSLGDPLYEDAAYLARIAISFNAY